MKIYTQSISSLSLTTEKIINARDQPGFCKKLQEAQCFWGTEWETSRVTGDRDG